MQDIFDMIKCSAMIDFLTLFSKKKKKTKHISKSKLGFMNLGRIAGCADVSI